MSDIKSTLIDAIKTGDLFGFRVIIGKSNIDDNELMKEMLVNICELGRTEFFNYLMTTKPSKMTEWIVSSSCIRNAINSNSVDIVKIMVRDKWIKEKIIKHEIYNNDDMDSLILDIPIDDKFKEMFISVLSLYEINNQEAQPQPIFPMDAYIHTFIEIGDLNMIKYIIETVDPEIYKVDQNAFAELLIKSCITPDADGHLDIVEYLYDLCYNKGLVTKELLTNCIQDNENTKIVEFINKKINEYPPFQKNTKSFGIKKSRSRKSKKSRSRKSKKSRSRKSKKSRSRKSKKSRSRKSKKSRSNKRKII